MRPKNWTTCFARFASLLLVVAPAWPCGSQASIEDETFLDPAILGHSNSPPWGPAYDPYLHGYGSDVSPSDHNESLLREWEAHLRGKVAREDWRRTLFDLPIPQIDSAILFLKGKSSTPPTALASSSILSAPDRARMIAALYYVGFARRIEIWLGSRPVWQDESQDEFDSTEFLESAARLLQGGSQAAKAARDPFLRQRYHFQLVRIRFYSGAWDSCVALADRFRGPLDGPSADLAWRTRSYVAGALRRSGHLATSNLEWARIYRDVPRARGTALQGFQPIEEADWLECLGRAADPTEKASLWMMMGIRTNDPRALFEVLALDSAHPGLPLLLVRLLNVHEIGHPIAFAPPDSFERIVDELAGSKRVAAPRVWQMGAAMLAAYRGDTARVHGLSRDVLAGSRGDTIIASQLRLFRIQALLNAGEAGLDSAGRAFFAREMRLFESKDYKWVLSRESYFRSWVRERLAERLFRDSASRAVAFLLKEPRQLLGGGTGSFEPARPDTLTYRRMIAYLRNPRTDFDRWTKVRTDCGLACQLNTLAALKMRQNRFREAMRILDSPGAGLTSPDEDGSWPKGSFARFDYATSPWDSLHVDAIAGVQAPATRDLSALARSLLELRAVSRSHGDTGAAALYAIGVLLYHLRDMPMDTVESWLSQALRKARQPELQGRIAYMGARAELEGFYARHSMHRSDGRDSVVHAHRWFAILRRKASQTDYYQDVIRECGYFRDWLRTQEKQCRRG